jgi:SM-20-related protein
MSPEMIARELKRSGLCVCPNFLSDAFLVSLREDLRDFRKSGKLRAAGIGAGNSKQVNSDIRRDEILWLEKTEATDAQKELWSTLDLLTQAFNRTLFLGIREFEGHYAAYVSGAFYQKHFDSFKGNNSRVVSLILYLNENWQPGDGGELKVELDESRGSKIIEPRGGTLVCFLSADFEHEVLESHHDRISFTGWFKT